MTSKQPKLQVVTQTITVAPSSAKSDEVEKLKKDIKKLREYLKTSVQERKLLLRKIGSLNDRIAEQGKSQSGDNASFGGASIKSARYLLIRIANLQQRLANACEDGDILRSHLESLADNLEPMVSKSGKSIITQDLINNIRKVVEESRQMSKVNTRAPTPLVFENTEDGVSEPEEEEKWQNRSNSSMSSDWRHGLPDPSDLLEAELRAAAAKSLERQQQESQLQSTNLVLDLNKEIERRNKDIETKLSVLDMLENQIGEKDQLIEEQSRLLNEYRLELSRYREAEDEATPRLTRRSRSGKKSLFLPQATSSPQVVKTTRGVSLEEEEEEEDSWSEPDVNAARKRMGLTLAKSENENKEETSETDMEKRKYCRFCSVYSATQLYESNK